MKNLKELIKPGYIVDIESEDESINYRYIVVDSIEGLTFHSIDDYASCAPLKDFDNNLINGYDSTCRIITGIYQLNFAGGCTEYDHDLKVIWKRNMLNLTIEEIAKKFNTTPDNIRITTNGN